ncbi:MAG: hypothetical protein WCG25_00735 [bacterium]
MGSFANNSNHCLSIFATSQSISSKYHFLSNLVLLYHIGTKENGRYQSNNLPLLPFIHFLFIFFLSYQAKA